MTKRAAETLTPRRPTPARPVRERVGDFDQAYGTPDMMEEFGRQARRCCQCFTPFCKRHESAGEHEWEVYTATFGGCPLRNFIPQWLEKVSEPSVIERIEHVTRAIQPDLARRAMSERALDEAIKEILAGSKARIALHEAFKFSTATNPLPEILGTICPQDVLCEGGGKRIVKGREIEITSCVPGHRGHKPVTIGNVERLIGRVGRVAGWLRGLIEPRRVVDRTVAVIGAGPAGMAAAIRLANYGFRVRLYFRERHIGGLLMYGVPGFKLSKEIVLAYEDLFLNSSIELIPETDVDEAAFAEIHAQNDRVILATGAQRPNELEIEGIGKEGVVQALPYLGAVIRSENLGETGVQGTAKGGSYHAGGRRVIVIGGGDTSIDCVRTAIRQGAEEVMLIYRGANMPASARERKMAEEEGVLIELMRQPAAIDGDARVEAVRFSRRDAGRSAGDAVEADVNWEYKADMVIQALGFTVENERERLGISGLLQAAAGRNAVLVSKLDGSNPDLRVLREKEDAHGGLITRCDERIFAAGDAVRGPSLAVWATLDGREAADRIIAEHRNGRLKAALRPALRR